MSERQSLGATPESRLTHAEEAALYHADRVTWAQYVAPRWRVMLEKASPEGKRELWALACPEVRTALNELKQRAA